MIVNGKVVSVEMDVQVAKNGGGSYPGARLAYRDENGAMKEKAFHNNVFKFNSELKAQLANLNPGDNFAMTMEKEGEFWNVKAIQPTSEITKDKESSNKDNKATPYTSPKSTYETPEERARKQVYIVRQSTINMAIAHKGAKASVEEILSEAKAFEDYVFDNTEDSKEIE